MKLLCIIPNYWPAFQYGGPVVALHYLNKVLVKKGIDVTVYTTNVGLNGDAPVDEEVNIDRVKVTYFRFANLFDFITKSGWQFSWQLTQGLKKNLSFFDLIYIVTVWSYPTTVGAYYCRMYRKPYIIAPQGMLYPDLFYKKIWKKWPYYQFVIKTDLRDASAIHYTTDDEAEKTHLFLKLKNQTIIIPNGIDLSEFSGLVDKERLKVRYPHLRDKKIILFLGRINWKKGLDILVRAYAMLIKERTDVHLLIVGGDEAGYIKKVKGWLKQYGLKFIDYSLEDKNYTQDVWVTFTGMLSGKEKIEAYAGSDIFVLPSYSENFGVAVAEAMASGTPVVISNNVGIYKDIERNRAGTVVDANAHDIYRGIKLLLEDPELRKEVVINGRRLVEELYDIDKVADKMIEAFGEILR